MLPVTEYLERGCFSLDSVLKLLHENSNADYLLLGLVALLFLLLIGWLVLGVRVRRLNQRLQRLTAGENAGNLEEVLTSHLATVSQLHRRMEAIEQAVGVLQSQIPHCLQQINLKRYDAFEDVGGEQSFSMALLDAKGDGIVLTSVYSRMDVRVYAKAIQNGKPSHIILW